MRNKSIDIIKGIAIVLMVYGHTFGVATDYIYLFHMPIFIFLSGYCFSKKHAQSLETAENYFFSRVRRLLIPYWVSNLIFLGLNNVFMKMGLYTDSAEFHDAVVPIQLAAQKLHTVLGPKDMIIGAYHLLKFDAITQMASATWFLVSLFYVCIIHCFLMVFVNKIENNFARRAIWCIVFVVCAVLTNMISNGYADEIGFPLRVRQIFEIYTCFLLGLFIKETELLRFLPSNRWQRMLIAAVSGGVLYYLLSFGTLEMSKCYIVNTVFLLICTVLGFLLLDSIAIVISGGWLEKVLVYVGNHTLSILILHILSFRLVSFVYIKVHGLPDYLLASWPVLFDVNELTKLIYTVVGVALPLLAEYVFDRVAQRFKIKS